MSPPGLLGLLPCCLGCLTALSKWEVLGLELCSLKTPAADTCGPYKKIIDQIRSILPWLLEA